MRSLCSSGIAKVLKKMPQSNTSYARCSVGNPIPCPCKCVFPGRCRLYALDIEAEDSRLNSTKGVLCRSRG
jgi:hypothetical protein